MATPAIKIRNLDHLGLVAALCKELGIAQMIDAVLPKTASFKVSHGDALVAMILNGLGFHSSTLHMFPLFFANKPVERLIGPGICADDLNDDADIPHLFLDLFLCPYPVSAELKSKFADTVRLARR